jgi:hypothetical protein
MQYQRAGEQRSGIPSSSPSTSVLPSIDGLPEAGALVEGELDSRARQVGLYIVIASV